MMVDTVPMPTGRCPENARSEHELREIAREANGSADPGGDRRRNARSGVQSVSQGPRETRASIRYDFNDVPAWSAPRASGDDLAGVFVSPSSTTWQDARSADVAFARPRARICDKSGAALMSMTCGKGPPDMAGEGKWSGGARPFDGPGDRQRHAWPPSRNGQVPGRPGASSSPGVLVRPARWRRAGGHPQDEDIDAIGNAGLGQRLRRNDAQPSRRIK